MAEILSIRLRRHVVDVELDIPLDPDRPITVLFGPSGAGKTTILRCLAGLDRPERDSQIVFGSLVWDDSDSNGHLPARERQIGYLFQEHALFPHLKVITNVAFGLHRMPRRERRQRAIEALATAGAAHLADRKAWKLSGGEGQRVALARALAPRPQLLLLDEPFSALDAPICRQLRIELRQLLLNTGIPALVVTHDRTEALTLGDRVAILVDGRVGQFGDVEDVFSRPTNSAVAKAVDMETITTATVIATENGMTTVRVAGTRLVGITTHDLDPETVVFACMRAENVALTLPDNDHPRGSPRNELPATITAITPDGPLVRVDLDAGFALSARITHPAYDDLQLCPGQKVTALIKATAVHLIPRSSPSHTLADQQSP